MKRILPLLVVIVLVVASLLVLGMTRTSAGSGNYGPFLGVWHIHGFELEVTSAGNVYATYRMYTWCSSHRRYACDKIVGNGIYAGGVWAAHLANPGKTQAAGSIDAGSDSSLMGTKFLLRPRPHDFMSLTWWPHGQKQQFSLCGPDVPTSMANKCGA